MKYELAFTFETDLLYHTSNFLEFFTANYVFTYEAYIHYNYNTSLGLLAALRVIYVQYLA